MEEQNPLVKEFVEILNAILEMPDAEARLEFIWAAIQSVKEA